MKQTHSQWLVTGLVAVIAVLATLVIVKAFDESSKVAFAQASEGSANYMIGVVGQEMERKMPLFLVDTRKRTVMVYEYDQRNRRLFLRAVRTYLHDTELTDENFDRYSSTKGPSVEDVKGLVRNQK